MYGEKIDRWNGTLSRTTSKLGSPSGLFWDAELFFNSNRKCLSYIFFPFGFAGLHWSGSTSTRLVKYFLRQPLNLTYRPCSYISTTTIYQEHGFLHHPPQQAVVLTPFWSQQMKGLKLAYLFTKLRIDWLFEESNLYLSRTENSRSLVITDSDTTRWVTSFSGSFSKITGCAIFTCSTHCGSVGVRELLRLFSPPSWLPRPGNQCELAHL